MCDSIRFKKQKSSWKQICKFFYLIVSVLIEHLQVLKLFMINFLFKFHYQRFVAACFDERTRDVLQNIRYEPLPDGPRQDLPVCFTKKLFHRPFCSKITRKFDSRLIEIFELFQDILFLITTRRSCVN